MTEKHTPGPWIVENEMDNGDIAICNKSESEIIAFVCGDDKKAKLDARLIAAAPELLEALRRLVIDAKLTGLDRQAGWDSFFAQAREAIAKATGDAA